MRARGVAVTLVLVATLLLGVQLVATDTGAVYGPHWTDPTTVAEYQVGPGEDVADLESASADPAFLAWLLREDGGWSVEAARVDSDGPAVSAQVTVAESAADLDDVGVAVDGDVLAVTWKNVSRSTIELAVRRGGTWQRHRFAGAAIVDEPSIALRDGVPVVAWQDRRNGTRAIQLAALRGDAVESTRFGAGVTGEGSPSLAAVGDRIAVASVDGDTSTATLRFASLSAGGLSVTEPQELGPARPRSTTRAGGGTVTVDVAASGERVSVLWTDFRTAIVRTAGADGTLGEPVEVTTERFPTIATAGDRSLVGWIQPGRTSSLDVAASYRTPETTITETVSRLSSTVTFVSPAFGPEAVLAWTERGGDRARLLVSRVDPDGARSFLDRLAQTPLQFVAVVFAGMVVGLVTLPMMPWSIVPLLGAFLLTTRAAVRALSTLGEWVGLAIDRPTRSRSVRDRLAALPPAVWVVQFGAGQTAVAVAVVTVSARARSVGFTSPVVTGIAAVVVTLAVVRLAPLRSNWWSVAAAAYAYNAAMWVTALPTFL